MFSAYNVLGEKLSKASGAEQEQFARHALIAMNIPIRNFIVPLPDGKTPYLQRFVLAEDEPKGGRTYLHIIYESDGDRDPHDHPFDFTSTIIWGSYREAAYVRACRKCAQESVFDIQHCPWCEIKLAAKPLAIRDYKAGDKNIKRAHELHKLEIIQGPVVTLIERGPKLRNWGFQMNDGWRGHESYIAEKFPGAQTTEID